MDEEFVESLRKFFNTMEIDYFIDKTNEGYGYGGRYVCYEVLVRRKGKDEYRQHHCYNNKRGGVNYDHGNEEIGVRDGILAYLGNEKEVDNFFEEKTRQRAIKYFNDIKKEYES